MILLVVSYKTPAAKTIEFNVVCERFVTPVPLALNLNHPPAQIAALDLYGFEGSASQVEAVDTGTRVSGQRSVKASSFSLESNPQDLPHLRITPVPAFGNMTAAVKSGVTLGSSGGNQPALRLESGHAGDTHFMLQSQAANLAGGPYRIPEIFTSNAVQDKFSLAMRGSLPGIFLEMTSGQLGRGPVRADVRFAQAADALQLTDGSSIELAADSNPQLELIGVLRPDIRIDGKAVTDVVLDHKTNLKLVAKSGRILSIGIASNSNKEPGPSLLVKGSVETRSLQQDGHELLPTLVQEVLDKPYAERKYWLILLGFLTFALFKIVDRAIGIVLKGFLPEA